MKELDLIKRCSPFLTAAVLASFSTVWTAMAQTVDAPAIEQRLSRPEGPPSYSILPEEQILTGKDDLVILERRKLFSLNASLAPNYTSNAFLSDANSQDDIVLDGALKFRAETVIDRRYTVFADVGLSTARHAKFPELDYDAAEAGFGGSIPSGLWTVSGNYRLTHVTEPGGFDEQIVTQNSLGATLYYRHAIDQSSAVFPFVSASRIWADPGDFTNVSLTPGVSYVRQLSPALLLNASVQMVVRRYDDFFEGATGEGRRDFGANASVGLRWSPYENIDVLGNLGAGRLNSSLAAVEYDEFSVTPSVIAKLRF